MAENAADGAAGALLFDIDGTLINTGGASDHAWRRAYSELYGKEVEVGDYTGKGITDPVVGVTSFRGAIGREPSGEEMARLMALRLTYLPDPAFVGGSLLQPTTIDLPANSRTTIPLQTTLGSGDHHLRFGLLVESIGTPLADLVVERAMYWNAGGETWAAGTNLLATPLP